MSPLTAGLIVVGMIAVVVVIYAQARMQRPAHRPARQPRVPEARLFGFRCGDDLDVAREVRRNYAGLTYRGRWKP